MKLLKKNYFNLHKQIILIIVILILFLSIGWKVLISVLERNGKYLFLNGAVYYDENGIFNALIIAAIGMTLFLILNSKKSRILITILCIPTLLLFSLGSYVLGPPDREYFSFVSPNKQNTLIIEECSWLFGGWSNCYIEIKPYLLEKWDSNIDTDDGYRPFSSGDYTIEWADDQVLITYGYGSAGIQKEAVLNLCG